MGWDGQICVGLFGHCRTVWYVPWDPTAPYGTNGMDHMVGLCSVSYGIPKKSEATV